jgi:hypothetical protein
MDSKEIQIKYRDFFKDSQAGEHFTNSLAYLIEQNHHKAENEPDNARDYTQRAKGVREVLDVINSYSATKSSMERMER